MLSITIKTDRDLTPAGTRTFRIVKTSRGGQQLRLYVSGRIFREMPVTEDNLAMARAWWRAP